MTQQSHWATDSFESTEINWSEQFSFQMQGRRATLLHRAGRYAPNNREIRCRCFGGLDRPLAAILAEAVNVRRVGGGIIYGPGAQLTP